jgi:hypothetical protein
VTALIIYYRRIQVTAIARQMPVTTAYRHLNSPHVSGIFFTLKGE